MNIADRITETFAALGLTLTAEFVPFSKSRYKDVKVAVNGRPSKEPQYSLNWRITVKRYGAPVLTTDYSAGAAHCPAYKASVAKMGNHNSVMRAAAIAWECEHGFASFTMSGGAILKGAKEPLQPELASVVASLASDADVLDYGTFEEWADNIGFDPDSRKAEAIYKACLSQALKLQAAIGKDGIDQLRTAAQDY